MDRVDLAIARCRFNESTQKVELPNRQLIAGLNIAWMKFEFAERRSFDTIRYPMMKCAISAVDSNLLDLRAVKELFNSCNWDWLEPDTAMKQAFANTFLIFKVEVDGQLVGFARVISDGKIYGHLVDVMIHPTYRRRGIGNDLGEITYCKLTREILTL